MKEKKNIFELKLHLSPDPDEALEQKKYLKTLLYFCKARMEMILNQNRGEKDRPAQVYYHDVIVRALQTLSRELENELKVPEE